MANKKIDQLTNLSTLTDSDLLLVYDVDGGSQKTKNMTYAQFHTLISGTVGGGGGGISEVVEDTTPQLGGDLDTNGNDIIVATADQLFIPNGTFDDPAIALSTDPNTGIVGGTLAVISVVQGAWQFAVSLNEVKTSATTRYLSGNNGTAAAPAYSFTNQSTLGMYYGASANLMFSTNSTARLEIESDGTLNVAGTTDYENLVLADDDIPNKKYVDDEISALATESYVDTAVDTASGTLQTQIDTKGTGDADYLFGANTFSGTGDIHCDDLYTSGSTIHVADGQIKSTAGNVALYDNGDPKFETTSSGIAVTGGIQCTGQMVSTGGIYTTGGTTHVGDGQIVSTDGNIELWDNGDKKFETTSSGVAVTGDVVATGFYGDGSNLTGVGSALPENYLTGLTLANVIGGNGSIIVDTGSARDASNTADMVLSSTLTKAIGSTWAAGDVAGGMFSGVSLTVDIWYHFFIIKKDSDGSIDAGYDTSITAVNIPAGYTAYRRVGSVLYGTGGSYLDLFIQHGDYFFWKSQIIVLDTTTPATSAGSFPTQTPSDIEVEGIFNVVLQNPTDCRVDLFSYGVSSTNPGWQSACVSVDAGSTSAMNEVIKTAYDNSLEYDSTSSSVTHLYVTTKGFIDSRGK